MKQKDKLLIELIKSVKLDSPSSGFTKNVMGFLEEESQLVEEMDMILGKSDLLPVVSNDFSTKTMKVLEERLKKPVFQPLLTKKTRMILMCALVMGYTFLLFDHFFLKTLYVSNKSLFKVNWFEAISRIPTIFWISIFSFLILLLLDSNLKKKSFQILR